MSEEVKDRVTGTYKALTGTHPAHIEIHAGILEKNPTGGPSGGDDHGGFSIADLANAHEFGLGVVERSFIRAWFDSSQDKINRKIAQVLPHALLGLITFEEAGEMLALWAGAEIQKYISSGNVQPPLKPETIERKGSSKPLIDKNLLRSAISGEAIVT